jgi:enoyl-CoA hydratase/carnithine racemase
MTPSGNGLGRSSHLVVERPEPQYWWVTFDHGPINTVTADTVAELSRLVDQIEQDDDLKVVVFTTANPEFFLAHYDTEGDPGRTGSMAPGPTGMHPWLDLTVRLSRAPVVSIASIRGRARGAGSEFVLACDIRLASDTAILAQFEVGTGVVPGGGPMARLPRLIGRGRALEVLLVADDIDAARAERYGYVNRVVPDDQLDQETDRIARRLASFDKQAIAETKSFVDATTLPEDEELPPGLTAFFASSARPSTHARLAALAARGLGSDSELERRLGELVPAATAPGR